MIPDCFFEQQIDESKKKRATTEFLRKFVLAAVDASLKTYYGSNYSTLCLQSSAAVNFLLSRYGIFSRMVVGSVCVIEIFKENEKINWQWGGFWNEEHHIFAISEFSDLIDLTISQLHLHPNSENRNFFPLLPFWWSPLTKWPPLIKYIPEKNAELHLNEREMSEIENFLATVSKTADELKANMQIEEIEQFPLLTGSDSLNYYTEQGNEWLVWAKKIAFKGISLPEAIIEKERAVINSFKPAQ